MRLLVQIIIHPIMRVLLVTSVVLSLNHVGGQDNSVHEYRVGTTHCQFGKARGNCMEVFGERLVRLLRGHSSLCTDRRATCPYRATNSQELRTSMLATTRTLFSKLATARVFAAHPPPLTLAWRPHCHLGIYRCQRSQATRAAAPSSPPPTVDTSKKVDR